MNLKTITIIFFTISAATAITLKCDKFRTSTWWATYSKRNVYECDSSKIKINSKTDRTITTIAAEHENGRQTSNINSIWIHDATVQYFPKNLQKFAQNLISIGIEESGLKEINSEDLKPFNNLYNIFLGGNELEMLDGDLFINNPELRRVFLDNNRIRIVGPEFFSNLKRIFSLEFRNNECYSGRATNHHQIAAVKSNVTEKCVYPHTTTVDPLVVKLEQGEIENEQLKKTIKNLNDKVKKLEEEVAKLKKEVEFEKKERLNVVQHRDSLARIYNKFYQNIGKICNISDFIKSELSTI